MLDIAALLAQVGSQYNTTIDGNKAITFSTKGPYNEPMITVQNIPATKFSSANTCTSPVNKKPRLRSLLATQEIQQLDSEENTIPVPVTLVPISQQSLPSHLIPSKPGLQIIAQAQLQTGMSIQQSTKQKKATVQSLDLAVQDLKSRYEEFTRKEDWQKQMMTGIEDIKTMLNEPVKGLKSQITALETTVSHPESGLEKKVETLGEDLKDRYVPRLEAVETKITALQTQPQPTKPASQAAIDEWTADDTLYVSKETHDALKSKVELLEGQAELSECNVRLLTQWADRMQVQHQPLECEVIFQQSKLIQNEVIVAGIREYKNENSRKAAISFFKNRMKLHVRDGDVHFAFRKGGRAVKYDGEQCIVCPRLMVVCCSPNLRKQLWQTKPNLVAKLMNMANGLFTLPPILQKLLKQGELNTRIALLRSRKTTKRNRPRKNRK